MVLLICRIHNIVLSNSLIKKLYAARSKREAELHDIQQYIFHCINSQSRLMKVGRLVTTENPSSLFPSLEIYLEAMRTKKDKNLTSAQNYINSSDYKVSEFQKPRPRQKYLVNVNMITLLPKWGARKLKKRMKRRFALLNTKGKWNR